MWFVLGLMLLAGSTRANAAPLSLDAYLKEVRQSHGGYRAASETTEGAALRAEEGSLLLAPTAFGSFQYIHDESPRLSPVFQGNKSTLTGYTLGVKQLTSFGASAALSYNINRTEIFGANPLFTPLPQYYDAKPLLELNFPVWRNLFGGETKADQERLEAQALATSFEQSFRMKAIVADAEATYWRLSAARKTVAIQKASLERAAAIRDWLGGQVRMQLSDRADLLQAVAAVRVRELELAAAQDELRSAALAFNSLRGNESDQAPELADLDGVGLDRASVPARDELRDDVKAAAQRERFAGATATMGLQRLSPSVEIYSQLALNGREARFGPAADQSFSSKYPYAVAGVRFTAPLDIGAILRSRSGYRHEKIAAEQDYDRRVFEQNQEWLDLTKRLDEAKSRLRLADEIVSAQKEKLEHERARHRRGRTTTYQVLLFEQDYAASRLTKLRNQSEIVGLLARMKTFGGQSR